jgi:methylase of polypeptide subunit release factors
MKNISSELNETSLQQLFDALEARGGKEYTLGYIFSMMHRFMDDNLKLRKDVEWHTNNIRKLDKISPWLNKEVA